MNQSQQSEVGRGGEQPHGVDLTFRITHPTIAGLDQLAAAIRDAHRQALATVPGGQVETLHGTAPAAPPPAAEPAPDTRRGRAETLIVGAFTALSFAATVGLALTIVGFAGYQLVRLAAALIGVLT